MGDGSVYLCPECGRECRPMLSKYGTCENGDHVLITFPLADWPKEFMRYTPTAPTMVFTIHHRGVDYVKLEDYTALAKTVADGSKDIDATEALRRLAMLARDYMTGSETGEADVDKYAKIVSDTLSKVVSR